VSQCLHLCPSLLGYPWVIRFTQLCNSQHWGDVWLVLVNCWLGDWEVVLSATAAQAICIVLSLFFAQCFVLFICEV